MRKLNVSVVALFVLLLMVSTALVSAANPPQPTYASANVDGDASEWNTTAPPINPPLVGTAKSDWSLANPTSDWFDYMYRAGDPTKDVLSNLYVRYDCTVSPQILYVHVLGVVPGSVIINDPSAVPNPVTPADAFVKIAPWGTPAGGSAWTKLVDGNSGDDGTAPDFQWVGQNGNYADGWEASAALAPGSYALNVHTQVTDGAPQTSAVADRSIDLVVFDCTTTAIELVSFATTQGAAGSVEVTWETAAEIDNAGFNLYRSSSPSGPYVKVNDLLIAAKGTSLSGHRYSVVDQTGYGTFFYKLEDVDQFGVATIHESDFVMVAPQLLRPMFRPVLPSNPVMNVQ